MRRPSASLFLLTALLSSTALFAVPVRAADPVLEGDVKQQIEGINSDVKKKKSELEKLNKQAESYRNVILKKKAESVTLEEQIGLIENRAAKTQLDIDIAEKEIDGLELQMKALETRIAEQEQRMVKEREMLGTLARKLYRLQFRKSTFDILLTKRSLSEFFDAVRQISDLQSGVNQSLQNVMRIRAELARERDDRETKRVAVEDSKRRLEVSKRELEDQKALKEAILLETKSSELEFRYMLADLKREQGEADSEIAYLEKALREKMDLAERLKGEDTILSWPLVPARGLSTRFHDPEYPFRYVYEHPGIDIRAYQATPVRASAAGVVARAKDAGMGYSYVMVIHNNSVSTVYGHLSRIVAREDAFVERGEIIGYSGGMPGTPGAGRMTTGPHLHYETRVAGIPADPLRFLVKTE